MPSLKKQHIASVKEAFDAKLINVEYAIDHGRSKAGDKAKMHPSTAAALKAHKVLK